MEKRKSRVLWVGLLSLTKTQKSEINDRYGNVEIRSKVLKNKINTCSDLSEIFEEVKDYNIIIIQIPCFKNSILKDFLEYNKEKLKKVILAFCQLRRRPTRKGLVCIQSSDRSRYYDQIEL